MGAMGRVALLGTLAGLLAMTLVPTSSAAVCASAAGCEFWDDQYHEYILYEVDTSTIDVVILPPATPFAALGDMDVLRASVEAWDTGIDALGPSWLADGVTINTYVLGIDNAPQEALADPEIIVATAEYNPVLLFGIGQQAPFGLCTQQGGVASTLFQHGHGGSSVQAVQCESGGIQCLVLNTNFLLGGAHRLYDLNAHEVGHCLGVGHVGDALDFDAKTVPLTDIMSYNDVPSQVHCVSTLNLKALEAVYAPLLGQPGGQTAGTFVHMSPADYVQVNCPNP